MFVFYCRMLQEAWFVEFRFIESWPLPKFILYSAVCGVVEYTVIYCTVLYSMAAYIVLCTMTMTVQKTGSTGYTGYTPDSNISSSLTSTEKDTSIYFYIYFTFSTSRPTPSTLQTSSNKTLCLKEH